MPAKTLLLLMLKGCCQSEKCFFYKTKLCRFQVDESFIQVLLIGSALNFTGFRFESKTMLVCWLIRFILVCPTQMIQVIVSHTQLLCFNEKRLSRNENVNVIVPLFYLSRQWNASVALPLLLTGHHFYHPPTLPNCNAPSHPSKINNSKHICSSYCLTLPQH